MNIDEFMNVTHYDMQYRNFVADYFYEYERLPNEDESYDFFVQLAQKYNEDALVELGIEDMEKELEYGKS